MRREVKTYTPILTVQFVFRFFGGQSALSPFPGSKELNSAL